MKLSAAQSVCILSCTTLFSACGGGGDENQSAASNADVAIYGTCGNAPNYYASISHVRWKRFPLTVAIDLSAAPRLNEGNNASTYLREIQFGAAGWAQSNGLGLVSFVSGRDADIIIQFVGNLPINILGQTNVWPTPTEYQKKGVLISLNSQAFSNLATTVVFAEALRGVTLHEMGHALFAAGPVSHSPFSTGDVMSSGSSEFQVPQQRDINTLRETYCRPL